MRPEAEYWSCRQANSRGKRAVHGLGSSKGDIWGGDGPGPITLIYACESRDAVHSHIGVTPAKFAAVATEAAVLTSAQPGRQRGPADVHMFLAWRE